MRRQWNIPLTRESFRLREGKLAFCALTRSSSFFSPLQRQRPWPASSRRRPLLFRVARRYRGACEAGYSGAVAHLTRTVSETGACLLVFSTRWPQANVPLMWRFSTGGVRTHIFLFLIMNPFHKNKSASQLSIMSSGKKLKKSLN